MAVPSWTHGFLARLGTGVAMTGSLAWFLWPDAHWKIEPEPLVAFAVAALAWLASTLTDNVALSPSLEGDVQDTANLALVPHQHDIRLLNRFNNTVPQRSRSFLRDLDFGTLVARDGLTPFNELVDNWDGADYEFVDEEVEHAWRDFRKALADLLDRVAVWTYPSRNNPQALTAKTDMDVMHGTSSQTVEQVGTMNRLGLTSVKAMDNFIRVARKKLEIA